MSEVTAVPLRPIAKGSITKLWLGIAAVALVGVGVAYTSTEKQVVMAMTPEEFLASNAKAGGVVTTASGLQYKVLEQGNGVKPGPSDIVLVNYEGKLQSGKVFDTTRVEGKPRAFPIGGTVPGFDEGLQLMNKGSKYRFWMPPNLGYPQGAGNMIPPNSVLIFDVELLEIAPQQAGMGAMPPGHGGM